MKVCSLVMSFSFMFGQGRNDGGRKVEKQRVAYLFMPWIISPHSVLLNSSHSHTTPLTFSVVSLTPNPLHPLLSSLSFISVSPSFSFILLTFHLLLTALILFTLLLIHSTPSYPSYTVYIHPSIHFSTPFSHNHLPSCL